MISDLHELELRDWNLQYEKYNRVQKMRENVVNNIIDIEKVRLNNMKEITIAKLKYKAKSKDKKVVNNYNSYTKKK